MNYIKDIIFNKNPMLVLSYLTKNPNKDNMVTYIAKELSLSVGSVHAILKKFESLGIADSRHIGSSIIYEVDKNSPLIKSFRIFDNLLELKELVDKLKSYTRKIILFGSCSRGEDTSDSDIDLLIIADEPDKDIVMDLIDECTGTREIKPVIVDEIEFMEMEKSDTVFFNEVIKGIELWEVSNEYNR
jgi:predicted nucleotidyltransferase